MSVVAPAPRREAGDRLALKTPRVGEIVLLDGIRWSTYEAILRDLGDHTRLRLTYDHGRLQIMSPLPIHERVGRLFGLFLPVLALASQIPCACLGSSTIHREDIEQGLEPDNCFHLMSWPKIRGVRDFDFSIVPPPDLAVEVDITCSSLNRMAIYATLGVPEIWRFDGEALKCFHRTATSTYEEHPNSLAFPFLRVADLAVFLADWYDHDDLTLTQRFQDWLRTQAPPVT